MNKKNIHQTRNEDDQDDNKTIFQGFLGWVLFGFAPLFMAYSKPYFYFSGYNGFWFNLMCVYTHFFFVKKDKNDGWEWYCLIGYAAGYYAWIRYVSGGYFCFTFLVFLAMCLHQSFRKDEWIAKTENKDFQDKIQIWLDRMFLTLVFLQSINMFLNINNIKYWTLVYLVVLFLIDRLGWFAEWRRSKKYNYPFTWD